MSDIYAMLDEVAGLAARIKATPELPFASLAPRYTALAIHALETQLVENEKTEEGLQSTNVPHALVLLRKIAELHECATLVAAVQTGDASHVELMIESTAAYDTTAFKIACFQMRVDIVRLFLDVPDAVNSETIKCALQTASEYGHVEIVRLLVDLDRGVDSNALNDALKNSFRKGHIEITRMLLELAPERGIGPEAINAILHEACENGHVKTVRMILELSLGRGMESAILAEEIRSAIQCRNIKCVPLLLEVLFDRGVDLDVFGNNALKQAIDHEHDRAIALILDTFSTYGVSLMRNHDHLIHAVFSENTEAVRMLLDVPAERGINDDELVEGFEIALRNNYFPICRSFWERGLITIRRGAS